MAPDNRDSASVWPISERIFEQFYRGAEARDRASGGIGLGLAVTARVMVLRGGLAEAKNAADGGLIVELRFPAAGVTAAVYRSAS